MTLLSPSYDNKIARKYAVKTLEHKVDNKLALQEELTWAPEPKRPLVCIPTALEGDEGALLKQIVPGLIALDIELVVRGKGSQEYGKLFTDLTKEHPHRIAIVQDNEDHMRKLLAGADIALFFSAPKEEDDLLNALRYGVVPVAPDLKGLQNYNPVQETGNAFIYDEPTVWHSFAAIVRAMETLKFPFDWRTIQRHAMESVSHE